jgi:hypothetical protein
MSRGVVDSHIKSKSLKTLSVFLLNSFLVQRVETDMTDLDEITTGCKTHIQWLTT